LNDEEKKLQVELAKLQADVKAYRILTISSAAFFSLLLISFLILSVTETSSFRTNNLLGLFVSIILGFVFAGLFFTKMRTKRMEIDELKSKQVQLTS
jgi:uncharacterized membrane-anchored protein YhcB (DUF1043 family)